MRPIIALIAATLLLPACRGGGGDNPGGYSDSYWQDRRQKSDLAHRRREPGDRSNLWGLALLGAAPLTRRRAIS